MQSINTERTEYRWVHFWWPWACFEYKTLVWCLPSLLDLSLSDYTYRNGFFSVPYSEHLKLKCPVSFLLPTESKCWCGKCYESLCAFWLMIANLAGNEFMLLAPCPSLTFMKLLNGSIVGMLSAGDKVSGSWGENRSPWNRWDAFGTWHTTGVLPDYYFGLCLTRFSLL